MYGALGHKTNHKRFVCRRCLTAFNTESKLETHKEICTDKGCIQRKIFPKEEDKIVRFRKYKSKLSLPFVVYADIECKLVESSEEDIISNHVPICVAYGIASTDPKWKWECQLFTGNNCKQQLLKVTDKLVQEVKDVMQLEMTM